LKRIGWDALRASHQSPESKLKIDYIDRFEQMNVLAHPEESKSIRDLTYENSEASPSFAFIKLISPVTPTNLTICTVTSTTEKMLMGSTKWLIAA
jgi:hypothetical protein